jgi:cellulose synthase/poly-beta-1,6-N-acetylglucosamine synthase-like glycosyltransferase
MFDVLLSMCWVVMLLVCAVLILPAALVLAQVLLALLPARQIPASSRPKRIAVLVPAHNEGQGLRSTLLQALAQLEPQDQLLVVADNCSDDTAIHAREAGAAVVERHDLSARGKGYALDFGLRHLAAAAQEGQAPDVVIVLDADCQLGPQLLTRIAAVAHATGRPVQATYLMRAVNASLKARVAEFAMRVKNRLRPRGMHRLAWPCGLYGTGMAFPWHVAIHAPFASGHLAEDMQLGVGLAQLGTLPLFCEDALVTSVFAGSTEGEASQRTRWEHGHLALLVSDGPRLLWDALCSGNTARLMQLLDMLVPPLALLAMLLVANTAIQVITALWLGWMEPLCIAMAGIGMLVIAVVVAQQRVGRDLLSLAELSRAPLVLLAKVPLYIRFVFNRQMDWVRTKRD